MSEIVHVDHGTDVISYSLKDGKVMGVLACNGMHGPIVVAPGRVDIEKIGGHDTLNVLERAFLVSEVLSTKSD